MFIFESEAQPLASLQETEVVKATKAKPTHSDRYSHFRTFSPSMSRILPYGVGGPVDLPSQASASSSRSLMEESGRLLV
jgi:hypothetical protein